MLKLEWNDLSSRGKRAVFGIVFFGGVLVGMICGMLVGYQMHLCGYF